MWSAKDLNFIRRARAPSVIEPAAALEVVELTAPGGTQVIAEAEALLVHDLVVVRLYRLTGGGQVVEGNAWVHVVGNVHEDIVEEHVEESRNVEIGGAGDLALELAP